jgi:SAM-dependent methyltransferase
MSFISTGHEGSVKIVNPKVSHDIENDTPLRLDLGGGSLRKAGFYTVDLVPLKGVDVIADLNEPLSEFPDNCVDYLYTSNTLEHIRNLDVVLSEIRRITRPGGTIEIIVPHFSNPFFYSDPTHVRFFGVGSMYYYVDPDNQPRSRKVPAYYNDIRFHVDSVRISFYKATLLDRLIVPLLKRLVNRRYESQVFYERRLCSLFHACEVHYVLRPDK